MAGMDGVHGQKTFLTAHGTTKLVLFCLAMLLPLGTAAQTPTCVYPPYEVHLEGDVHPLEAWPSWLEDGNGEAVVAGGAFTITDFGDGYGLFQPNSLLTEGSWAHLAVRLRVDSYVLLNESSGNFFGYSDLEKRVIFGLIVRGGSPSLTFADQELMDNGNGDPTLPTYPLDWTDGEYHDIDLLIDYTTGSYHLVVDADEYDGQYQDLPDVGPVDPDETPWPLAMFSVGASTVDGVTTYDSFYYDVCVDDCETRGRGEGTYEGDVLPTEADPPWLIPDVEENTQYTLVPNNGVLDVTVWSTTPEPGQLLLYMPAFPDLGVDVSMSAQIRQSTFEPTALPDWRMETGFGFSTATRSVFIGLLDHGAGERVVGLAGIDEQGQGVILGTVELDWTQFHEYTLTDSPLSDNIDLEIDGSPALSIPREDFPAVVWGSPGDGLAFISGAGENPVSSHIDFIRWEYKREGFVIEECDGYDNDCDGLVDNIGGDNDGDGVFDGCDNCPYDYNPGQEDDNGNGVGDICENLPVANAGQDKTVKPGDYVVLDGSGSYTTIADGLLNFEWRQVGGPSVEIFGETRASPAFKVSAIDNEVVYEFELVVSDYYLSSLPDSVRITAIPFTKDDEKARVKEIEKMVKALKDGKVLKGLKKELLKILSEVKKRGNDCWEKTFALEELIERVSQNTPSPIAIDDGNEMIAASVKLLSKLEPCVGRCEDMPLGQDFLLPIGIKGDLSEVSYEQVFEIPTSGLYYLWLANGIESPTISGNRIEKGRIYVDGYAITDTQDLKRGPTEYCIALELEPGTHELKIDLNRGQQNRALMVAVKGLGGPLPNPPPPTQEWQKCNSASKPVYGLFWMGPGGIYDRVAIGDSNFTEDYFDPNRPTLIHVHGWQPWGHTNISEVWDIAPAPRLAAVADDVKEFSVEWIKGEGYNLGFFDWKVFNMNSSGETEDQVWSESIIDGLTYRYCKQLIGEVYTQETDTSNIKKNVGALFADSYKEMASIFPDGAEPEIVVVGHSMGTHVVASGIAQIDADPEVEDALLPDSIYLLDTGFAFDCSSLPCQPYNETRPDDFSELVIGSGVEPGLKDKANVYFYKEIMSTMSPNWDEEYRKISRGTFDFWVDKWADEKNGHNQLVHWFYRDHMPRFWTFFPMDYWTYQYVKGAGILKYDAGNLVCDAPPYEDICLYYYPMFDLCTTQPPGAADRFVCEQ